MNRNDTAIRLVNAARNVLSAKREDVFDIKFGDKRVHWAYKDFMVNWLKKKRVKFDNWNGKGDVPDRLIVIIPEKDQRISFALERFLDQMNIPYLDV